MSEELRKQLEEQTVPQKRLDQGRKIASEFAAATALLREKKYKEALRKFKWVFSNTTETKYFLSSREIRSLAKHYAPGASVIRRWRNDKERLVIAKQADSNVISEWDILNECLGEKQRTIDVFRKLTAAGADDEILHKIFWHIWKHLARSRKYEELRPFLRTLGWLLLLHIVDYDCETWFPRSRNWTKTQVKEEFSRMRNQIADEGPLICEVALGLGEASLAEELSNRVLSVERSDRVYASLIKGAIRTRIYPAAQSLFGDAKSHLSTRQLRLSAKVVRTIPKSKRAASSA
jgi:hypothetical protein